LVTLFRRWDGGCGKNDPGFQSVWWKFHGAGRQKTTKVPQYKPNKKEYLIIIIITMLFSGFPLGGPDGLTHHPEEDLILFVAKPTHLS
jgi:hypothetical protein